jgi:hypothetical protein
VLVGARGAQGRATLQNSGAGVGVRRALAGCRAFALPLGCCALKLLNSIGEVIVKAEPHAPPSSYKVAAAAIKPFVPHYGEFTFVGTFPDDVFVYWTVYLADGVAHDYYYQIAGDGDLQVAAVDACNFADYFPGSPLLGGEFFNPVVRGNLVSKDVSPV